MGEVYITERGALRAAKEAIASRKLRGAEPLVSRVSRVGRDRQRVQGWRAAVRMRSGTILPLEMMGV